MEPPTTRHSAPTAARPDSAGVRFPPPLIFLLAFAAGWGLQRLRPMTLLPRDEARVAALVLVVAWVGLTAWTLTCFRRHHTSVVPVKPTTALIVKGPFRITRNPLYLGMLMLYAGVALWFDALWPFVLLLPLVLVIQQYAIRREERYLARTFGDAYRAYTGRVRRWI
ncbi:MAG TPA: isoprenylcysteine carboxylmethyltransferase family protein [Gemmatimonadaceae bacterium]|nr:isoprenylcysteine carboxylmethyltransferase family protein [Gemmatimonadaceae bacterium]